MSRPSYQLFDRDSTAFIFGLQANAIQRMLDFDTACKREKPSVSAIINPGRTGNHKVFWGTKEILLPIYPDVASAVADFPEVDVMINFASFRSAYSTTLEAMDHEQLRTIVIIAEGMPERRARHLRHLAREKKINIIGPATVGGVKAGCFRIANTGGTIENIINSKLHRPGSVGFVSKSGGMSNEMYNVLAQWTDGTHEGIAIGGDAFPCSTLLDHLLRYQANPDIKMLVCLGEVGGEEEYRIAEAIKSGQITKPVVVWVTGTALGYLPQGVQFGHAGAKADADRETAPAKNKALREAGALVPESYNDFAEIIKKAYDKLVADGDHTPVEEVAAPVVPIDFKAAKALGQVRRNTNFISTICDDSGDELSYAGHKISKVIGENYALGDVISLLWFKEKLPSWATQFMEIVVKLTADHGPAVSGAHNAIVTARAGRDLMSAVASGMLTIGPRFGGAVAGAAVMFKEAYDNGWSPEEFVNIKKKQKINIQGIGHRIKSLRNPDQRVELLKEYAFNNFAKHDLLNYALEVEQVTTKKKDTLILNVDGAIGILMIDMMAACGFSGERIQEVVDSGGLNGFFLLGRTIGMIGHYMDQKRLKSALYRHPWDDILYLLPEVNE
ncbi:MAG TPA: ATP citrate synthase [Myxococcales bacterium]|nr:ATP citrate synthase [Myxococcales bacterium]